MAESEGEGGGNAERSGESAGICGKWCGDTVDRIDPGVECVEWAPATPPPPKEPDREDTPWKEPLREWRAQGAVPGAVPGACTSGVALEGWQRG